MRRARVIQRAVFEGVLWLCMLVPCMARAYTGGPLRVEFLGYSGADERLYFRESYHDESGKPPRTFYISLSPGSTLEAIHARSLDVPIDSLHNGAGARRSSLLRRRLAPLMPVPAYELQIAVQSDSVGVHPNDRVAALSLRIDLDCAGATRHLDLAAYFSPTVTVRSLFAVPNRPERVVLISYLGRSHYCEETDLPVILRP